MGSEKNDIANFSPSEPILCVNGCGFFGTPSNMDLCSKCYRDIQGTEAQAASAKTAIEKSLNTKFQSLKITPGVNSGSISSSTSGCDSAESSSDQPKSTRKTRCSSCNKKVGIIGFKCKCGSTFCGTHRYPESHDCEFDYKVGAKEAIAKANPLVKADKIVRI